VPLDSLSPHLATPDLVAPVSSPARLRLALASIHFVNGRADQAVAVADGLLKEGALPPRLYPAAESIRLRALLADDDSAAVRRRAEAILGGGDRPDADAALPFALAALASLAWSEGRVAHALGLGRAAVKRLSRTDHFPGADHPRLDLAAMLTALGHFDEADTLIAVAAEAIDHDDGLWRPLLAVRQAENRLASGCIGDAAVHARRALALAHQLGAPVFMPAAASVLARVKLLLGDVPAAAEQLAQHRAAHTWSTAVLWTALQVDEVLHGPTRVEDAVAGIADELPAHRRLLLEQPEAAAWLVRVCLTARDIRRATALVDGAQQLAAANPEFPTLATAAAQAHRLLYDQGASQQPRADRPTFGWASLTGTELQVAHQVAEGLTNAKIAERLFVSRHTVDSHLRHIFGKLGIGSRVTLTRIVMDHAG
jgi:ATP/maltotriose-dependent transcriptional regulator MalT